MITYYPARRMLIAVCSLVLIAGCGSTPKRNSAPLDQLAQATLVGHSKSIRGFGLETSPELQQDFVDGLIDGGKDQACEFKNGNPVMCVLVVSGGGGWGSYGAGLINGWTEAGNRPTFKIVTGISTGALIAPFAFLGPDYDWVLKENFTSINSEKDLIKRRSIFAIFSSDAIANTAPLQKRLETAIDKKVVDAIADAHRKGRRLYIGTTHLDAQRFTIWNIGEIALKGDIELIRKVILASTAVPAIMPPVSFDITVDGTNYQELHADCLLYTSPSPRDKRQSRMPSSA